jgi:ammonium transporter, Amt family
VMLCLAFWAILKATLGIRVTREEEFQGLDISEHGMEAYPGSSLGGVADYSKEIHSKRKSTRGSSEYPEVSGNL